MNAHTMLTNDEADALQRDYRRRVRIFNVIQVVVIAIFAAAVAYVFFGTSWIRSTLSNPLPPAFLWTMLTGIALVIILLLAKMRVENSDPHCEFLDDDELDWLRRYAEDLPDVRRWLGEGMMRGCVPRCRDLIAAREEAERRKPAPQEVYVAKVAKMLSNIDPS